jgi:hypothetical protein
LKDSAKTAEDRNALEHEFGLKMKIVPF